MCISTLQNSFYISVISLVQINLSQTEGHDLSQTEWSWTRLAAVPDALEPNIIVDI